jgi:hypothetical protein
MGGEEPPGQRASNFARGCEWASLYPAGSAAHRVEAFQAKLARVHAPFVRRGTALLCPSSRRLSPVPAGEVRRVPHRHPVNGCFLPERVAWRELPPQTGILSPFPASSWPDVVNSGAKRGLPCEILTISQGRERAEEGVFWRGAPTQPPPLRRGGVPPGLPARQKAFA